MKKILRLTACATLLAASACSYAAGWNCTNNPPAPYSGATFGSSLWGKCYLASAVDECKAGQMIHAPTGCAPQDVENTTMLARHHEAMGCQEMASKGWLPAGVPESQCVTDLTEFVTHCSGNPVSCS